MNEFGIDSLYYLSNYVYFSDIDYNVLQFRPSSFQSLWFHCNVYLLLPIDSLRIYGKTFPWLENCSQKFLKKCGSDLNHPNITHFEIWNQTLYSLKRVAMDFAQCSVRILASAFFTFFLVSRLFHLSNSFVGEYGASSWSSSLPKCHKNMQKIQNFKINNIHVPDCFEVPGFCVASMFKTSIKSLSDLKQFAWLNDSLTNETWTYISTRCRLVKWRLTFFSFISKQTDLYT